VSDEKTIRKLKKLVKRIHTQIESVKDTMEDLEIEFEVLKQLINRLEGKAAQTPSTEVEEGDDEFEDLDLENSSTTSTVNPKKPKKF